MPMDFPHGMLYGFTGSAIVVRTTAQAFRLNHYPTTRTTTTTVGLQLKMTIKRENSLTPTARTTTRTKVTIEQGFNKMNKYHADNFQMKLRLQPVHTPLNSQPTL